MMAAGVGTIQRIIDMMTANNYINILLTKLPATSQGFWTGSRLCDDDQTNGDQWELQISANGGEQDIETSMC